MNKKTLARIGITVVFLFLIFSFLVHKNIFTSFDFDTTVRLQNFISRRFDTLFSSFSLLGSVEVTTLILLVLVAFNRRVKSLGVLFLYLVTLVIEVCGKLFVNHPNPPFMFFRYDLPLNFPSSYVQTGSSFPSGHATRTSFVIIIILYMILKSKKIRKEIKIMIAFVILLALLTMFVSRVYLGEHWASDVIGGFLLGTGFSAISAFFL